MTLQLPLAVSLPSRATLDDFIAGANGQLLALVRETALEARGQQLFLSGAAGVGKSHLLTGAVALAARQGRSTAYLPLAELVHLSPEILEGLSTYELLACDDLQAIAGNRAWEEALFHLFNSARSADCNLLFAARVGPAALPLALPDLRSRLAWGQSYNIQPLDDAGREALLLRQAEQRGLKMQPQAAAWMVRHCHRDPGHLLALLERLDHASLASHRRLTLPFVRQQLGQER